jgi:hypothetical protein
MKRKLCVGRVLLALVPFLTVGPVAQAVALPTWNRVFISTTGNDANNCSDPATPCRTFIGAQAQTNAGGEIIAMATGGYGQLNITQSVTINGPAGVVIFSNFPVTVNAPGATVVLRGLTIDGTGQSGNGIDVTSVGNLHVESCVITGWTGGYPNGQGIFFRSAGELFVKDTVVRGNGNVGIFVRPPSGTAQASVDHCRLEQSSNVGLATDNSAGGTAKATVSNSVASGNGNYGLYTYGAELNAEGCLVANNGVGIQSDSGGVIRVSSCTVTDNAYGLSGGSGALLSFGNNSVAGNVIPGAFTLTISQQ